MVSMPDSPDAKPLAPPANVTPPAVNIALLRNDLRASGLKNTSCLLIFMVTVLMPMSLHSFSKSALAVPAPRGLEKHTSCKSIAFWATNKSLDLRSEERRVGKECRFRWEQYD